MNSNTTLLLAYPNGLKGDEIPRVAQIIAVADTFDAMYSDRPYRKRMNYDKAVSIIKDAAGTQLASDVVDAFFALRKKVNFARRMMLVAVHLRIFPISIKIKNNILFFAEITYIYFSL